MSSLTYIIVKTAKNHLLDIVRKPAKLALHIFLAAVIIGIFLLSVFIRSTPGHGIADTVWLKGIVFVLILIFVIIGVAKGLKSGDVIFSMSDVNFLFVSPIKPQSILLYGVIRMMAMSFLAGFFILFQGNSICANFDVNYGAVLLILLGFVLAISLMQIVSLIIYSVTNGKPKRKVFVRFISVAVFLPMIAFAVLQVNGVNGNYMLALENLLRSPVTSWTPVVGWAAEGTISFISGDIFMGLWFYGITIATGMLLIIYVMKSNPDYYEDALVATETAFEKKRAIAEGQINMEALSDKKVKITGMGIKGSGASAVFYKHLRESFRANRFGLWGMSSAIILITSVVIAIIMRVANEEGGNSLIILQVLMWMQIFFIGTGRGQKELYSHYIYMMPESSFRKIVWSNLEVVFKVFVESILAFGTAGVIAGEKLPIVVAVIVVFTLFSLLLIGISYLSLRWTGTDVSAGIQVFIYMIAVIIIMLPGLAAALIIGAMIEGWGALAGLLILAAWELFAAAVCFVLSKGILDRCDMPVMKTGK